MRNIHVVDLPQRGDVVISATYHLATYGSLFDLVFNSAITMRIRAQLVIWVYIVPTITMSHAFLLGRDSYLSSLRLNCTTHNALNISSKPLGKTMALPLMPSTSTPTALPSFALCWQHRCLPFLGHAELKPGDVVGLATAPHLRVSLT